jgi:hypothetical protein
VQHVNVQNMALDPFTAVDEPPEIADRAGHGDAECVLHRVHRAHLVGDRADAADARGDVGGFGEGAAAQESLEEARRLEDVEFCAHDLPIAHYDPEPAFALDAGEIIHLDGLMCHGAHFLRGSPAHWR